MDTLPVCKAKSKQTGKRCGNYAVRKRNVCQIHGGKTPRHNCGPKTAEGKIRQKRGSWKHGLRSKERICETQKITKLIKTCKSLISLV